ncbi:hypothetical protein LZ32DRAFT_665903, partial [Colletotrichum eremochloae]
APYKKLKYLGSKGSIVIRLKLKEINRRVLLGLEGLGNLIKLRHARDRVL